MTPQAFANFLWAFGKVEEKDEGMLEARGRRASQDGTLQFEAIGR